MESLATSEAGLPVPSRLLQPRGRTQRPISFPKHLRYPSEPVTAEGGPRGSDWPRLTQSPPTNQLWTAPVETSPDSQGVYLRPT